MATHEQLHATLPQPDVLASAYDIQVGDARHAGLPFADELKEIRELAHLQRRANLGGPIGAILLNKFALGGAAVTAVVALGAGFGGGASYDHARTHSKATLIAWSSNYGINPGTAYFQESLSVENVQYKISHVPDPHVNKQLDGIGQEQFNVPFDAIQQEPNGDKIDITVDASKITANVSWLEGSPVIRNYTRNKGGKVRNYDDQEGFRNTFVHGSGEAARLFSINKLGDSYDFIDQGVNHDMSNKGLDEFGPGCFGSIQKILEAKVVAAVEDSAAHATNAGKASKIGKFTFDGTWKFTPDDLPDAVKNNAVYADTHSWALTNFKIDNRECNINPDVAKQGLQVPAQ